MAWFLLGGHFSNGGPDNVNQALITSADRKFYISRVTTSLFAFWKRFGKY